jgi:prophage regulatory protein
MINENARTSRLIRRWHVQSLIGLSTSQIYKMMANGTFPQPVRLTSRSVAWWEHQVRSWMHERTS